MLHRLIGGRSIAGIVASTAAAIPVIIFLSGWNLGQSEHPIHWLMGSIGFNPVSSWLLSLIALIATAFVVRFQINRGSLSQSKGSHHLLLVPALACLSLGIVSFFQVAAACILALSFLMTISNSPQEKRRDPVFHAGIVFGISVLLIPDLIWAIIPLLVLMIRNGISAWRSWIALILGALFPFVILWTTALIFNFHEGLVTSFQASLSPNEGKWEIQRLVFPGLVLIASSIGFMASFPPLTVRDKLTLQTFGIWLLGVAILAGFNLVDAGVAVISLSVPVAVLTARWLEYVNRKWMVDLVYLGLIVGLLI